MALRRRPAKLAETTITGATGVTWSCCPNGVKVELMILDGFVFWLDFSFQGNDAYSTSSPLYLFCTIV
jgi:hypothetical protein